MPVRDLYNQALKRKTHIFFITAEKEIFRKTLERNLKNAGFNKYTKLIMESNDFKGKVQDFKTKQRKEIEKEGYRIIANIGDKKTDLVGGYSEKTFKLPNPFYNTQVY